MTATADLIHQHLAVLQPTAVELTDDSAQHAGHVHNTTGGGHYRLRITAPCFTGQSRIERHRIVHAALGNLLPGRIHAIAITALAPGE